MASLSPGSVTGDPFLLWRGPVSPWGTAWDPFRVRGRKGREQKVLASLLPGGFTAAAEAFFPNTSGLIRERSLFTGGGKSKNRVHSKFAPPPWKPCTEILPPPPLNACTQILPAPSICVHWNLCPPPLFVPPPPPPINNDRSLMSTEKWLIFSEVPFMKLDYFLSTLWQSIHHSTYNQNLLILGEFWLFVLWISFLKIWEELGQC